MGWVEQGSANWSDAFRGIEHSEGLELSKVCSAALASPLPPEGVVYHIPEPCLRAIAERIETLAALSGLAATEPPKETE